MILKIFINTEDSAITDLYSSQVLKSHDNIKAEFPDAGFDLYTPKDFTIPAHSSLKINLSLHCAAFDSDTSLPKSFYMYPRSSISKTTLRLANSVGIIDSGYRGELACVLDNIGDSPVNIDKGSRLLQICSPDLSPIKVEIVTSVNILGFTERGSGGFGSTGV